MLSNAEIEERRNYIGGSDVGAILGVCPYKTKLDVYLEKVEGQTSDANIYTYNGTMGEEQARKKFKDLTRLTVDYPCKPKIDNKYGFLRGNIDGFLPEKNAILELKTVGFNSRHLWGAPQSDLTLYCDGLFDVEALEKNNGLKGTPGYIPHHYLTQCAHYAAVYDAPTVYLAADFGTDMPIKIYQYNRNLNFENKMIALLMAFWKNNVLKKVPPEPMNEEDIKKLYPTTKPKSVVVATNEVENIFSEYAKLRQQEKEIGEKVAIRKKNLMGFMKDGERLITTTGDKLISWSEVSTSRLDTKELKIHKPAIAQEFTKTSTYRRFLPNLKYGVQL